MAKPTEQSKPKLNAREKLQSAIGAILIIFIFLASSSTIVRLFDFGGDGDGDLAEETFYDDPNLDYSIEKNMRDWDSKRRQWLHHHHHHGVDDGHDPLHHDVLLVTGSQPFKCGSPDGDHFLLRLFKNKVDYCRLHHGCKIFYSNAHLHPKMDSYWAKIPIIKASMIAHPETEWIWWVDSDAVITDMDFKLPLERYKDYNLVMGGYPDMVFEKRSWVGLNAGILLFRNCQWSMDFMDVWARIGPWTPNYEEWGRKLKATLSDKPNIISDDQSALVYLLLEEAEKWGEKMHIENEYGLHTYWLGVVNGFEKLVATDTKARRRRRHAEVTSENYAEGEEERKRRPFITHFTGCQPCSGYHNPDYANNSCRDGMEKALNFADNQVLRNYGFGRSDLMNFSSLFLLPFESSSTPY